MSVPYRITMLLDFANRPECFSFDEIVAGYHVSPSRTYPNRVPYTLSGMSASRMACRDSANLPYARVAPYTRAPHGSPEVITSMPAMPMLMKFPAPGARLSSQFVRKPIAGANRMPAPCFPSHSANDALLIHNISAALLERPMSLAVVPAAVGLLRTSLNARMTLVRVIGVGFPPNSISGSVPGPPGPCSSAGGA